MTHTVVIWLVPRKVGSKQKHDATRESLGFASISEHFAPSKSRGLLQEESDRLNIIKAIPELMFEGLKEGEIC